MIFKFYIFTEVAMAMAQIKKGPKTKLNVKTDISKTKVYQF